MSSVSLAKKNRIYSQMTCLTIKFSHSNPVEKELGLPSQTAKTLEGNNRLVDAYNVLHPEKKEGEKRAPAAATRARKVEDANPRRFVKNGPNFRIY